MKNTEKKFFTKKKALTLGVAAISAVGALAVSFAWMTSYDSINNHLETDGRQETSIVEQFNPPKEWTPGQTIVKDVAIANKGEVDSFVRVKLTESLETNVETSVTTPGTGTPVTYTDEQIAMYPTVIQNNGVVPGNITVKKNDDNGYIAYVTATKQKVYLNGLAFTMDGATPKATVTGTLGIRYATTVKSTTTGTLFEPVDVIDEALIAGQTYGSVKLTSADVEVLERYINAERNNLCLSQIDGTPIVIVLDESWTDNFDYNDGYFYYKRILPVGATSESLVKDVILLPQADNDWANAKYDITVEHDGIQAAVDCIADEWDAKVSGSNATIGSATVDTTGSIPAVE